MYLYRYLRLISFSIKFKVLIVHSSGLEWAGSSTVRGNYKNKKAYTHMQKAPRKNKFPRNSCATCVISKLRRFYQSVCERESEMHHSLRQVHMFWQKQSPLIYSSLVFVQSGIVVATSANGLTPTQFRVTCQDKTSTNYGDMISQINLYDIKFVLFHFQKDRSPITIDWEEKPSSSESKCQLQFAKCSNLGNKSTIK